MKKNICMKIFIVFILGIILGTSNVWATKEDLESTEISSDREVKNAIKKFDTDNNGEITKKEIKEVYKKEGDCDKELKHLINCASDKNSRVWEANARGFTKIS